MKLKLMGFLFVFAVSTSFAQTKYIQQPDGSLLDTAAYEKLKESQVQKIKAVFPDKKIFVAIKDNFKEIRRTNDSLIYSYRWDTKIEVGKSAQNKTKIFEPEEYIGKPFPIEEMKTIEGNVISFEQLKGKPSLINFWFVNCKPCVEEIPVLNTIKSKLKDSVHFIAVTYETPEKVKLFLKTHPYNFLHITNAKSLIKKMQITAYPLNFFLDSNGIIQRIENGIPYSKNKNGEIEISDGKDFEAFLKELISSH